MGKERHNNPVSRAEMVKRIRNRLKQENDIDCSRETIDKILDIFDDEIYTVIAENKCYRFLWGYIGGKSKPPHRVSGKFAEIKMVRDNYGYSTWKMGYPWVDWSDITKVYDIYPPEEYYDLPENRYTTEARTFRQIAKFPEIPEYRNLPEEKILEYCKKADSLHIEKLTTQQRANKRRDIKFNGMKIKAMHEHWEKINYKPMGTTTEGWNGPTIDSIDYYLEHHLPGVENPLEKLEIVLTAKDLAEYKDELKDHPELDELIEQFRNEAKEQGLVEIPYVKKQFLTQTAFELKYKGQEDPWGILSTSSVALLTKLRKERIRNEERNFLESLLEENKKAGGEPVG